MKMRQFFSVMVGVIVLSAGLVLANYGSVVIPAMTQGVAPDSHITGIWDSALPSAKRLLILKAFNGEAVLHKNTGLDWRWLRER